MGFIAITSVTERRARVQPERNACLQIEQLSLALFVLKWKLCKNDETAFYSQLTQFTR